MTDAVQYMVMQEVMDRYDITVIGAGPAGLFCAIHAAEQDRRVLVLEKMQAPGRKLLLTGSGQCNITHGGEIQNFLSHYGKAGNFLKPALLAFTNHDLVRFFHKRGLETELRKDGKVFPVSRKSSDVLSLLVSECRKLKIAVCSGEPVHEIKKDEGGGFGISTSTRMFYSAFLVIATGGASYPATGSTGDGYRFAASMGHSIREIAPALAPLYIHDFPFSDLSGMSFPSMYFSVSRNGKKLFHHTGDVLFTHTGISGPGILDCSRDILPKDIVRLSFMNPAGHDGFFRSFYKLADTQGKRKVKSLVSHYQIPDRLIKKILEFAGIPHDLPCAQLSAPLRSSLARGLSGFPLKVDSVGDFSVAMVTRGGINLDEVYQKTMESRIVKNLYFAGEVLDIDGDTGGYNIQSAFSTGMLAAQSIKKNFPKKQVR